MRENEGLKKLGFARDSYPSEYSVGVIRNLIISIPDNDYFIKFNCPEFTKSLSNNRST